MHSANCLQRPAHSHPPSIPRPLDDDTRVQVFWWSAAVHFFLKWGVLTMGWGYILTKWSYINYWTARAFPPSAMPIFIMGSIVGLRRASTPTPTSGADVEKWRARADLMTIGLLLWMAVSSTYS